ncbi:MAG: hypothetical protein COA32_02595 [Fluviicola sp.]|nr:MAG: hypothetical protein COA32_02595 [Fluviicola sp.]
MKKLIYTITLFIVFSCIQEKDYNPILSKTPIVKKVKQRVYKDSINHINFHDLEIPQLFDSYDLDDDHVKMYNDSMSILIIPFSESDLFKTLSSNKWFNKMRKKYKLENSYETLNFIYNITPQTDILEKDKFLALKETLLPIGVNKGFYELRFSWSDGFQTGAAHSEIKFINLFTPEFEYYIIFRKVNEDMFDKFVGKLNRKTS